MNIAGERLLSNLSRFVMMVWVFVVLVLTSSYTATLTSMLTVQQISSFTSGCISNLNFQNYHLRPFNSVKEYAEALSRGSKDGGVPAIMDEIPYIKLFLAKYPKHYSMIGSPQSTTNGFAFVSIKSFSLSSFEWGRKKKVTLECTESNRFKQFTCGNNCL